MLQINVLWNEYSSIYVCIHGNQQTSTSSQSTSNTDPVDDPQDSNQDPALEPTPSPQQESPVHEPVALCYDDPELEETYL